MVNPKAEAVVDKFEAWCQVALSPATRSKLQWDIHHVIEEETKEMRDVLQGIIDGAVHPKTAVRRVMVDLAPIRKVLAAYNVSETPKTK
jgi:hypothetical protein